mmetsp:Transcript_23990/g.32848  ORF Transcript_23990/g.32848 Transcript_23990/m.32848 type:complete len:205 (+) Transcript_23990:341-955(+)
MREHHWRLHKRVEILRLLVCFLGADCRPVMEREKTLRQLRVSNAGRILNTKHLLSQTPTHNLSNNHPSNFNNTLAKVPLHNKEVSLHNKEVGFNNILNKVAMVHLRGSLDKGGLNLSNLVFNNSIQVNNLGQLNRSNLDQVASNNNLDREEGSHNNNNSDRDQLNRNTNNNLAHLGVNHNSFETRSTRWVPTNNNLSLKHNNLV